MFKIWTTQIDLTRFQELHILLQTGMIGKYTIICLCKIAETTKHTSKLHLKRGIYQTGKYTIKYCETHVISHTRNLSYLKIHDKHTPSRGRSSMFLELDPPL